MRTGLALLLVAASAGCSTPADVLHDSVEFKIELVYESKDYNGTSSPIRTRVCTSNIQWDEDHFSGLWADGDVEDEGHKLARIRCKFENDLEAHDIPLVTMGDKLPMTFEVTEGVQDHVVGGIGNLDPSRPARLTVYFCDLTMPRFDSPCANSTN